jgi:hypothetical protein
MTGRTLSVTIDTEVDKSPDWSISNPATYRSVDDAVPRLLTPLFARYGARPTYLVSPEVLDEPACVAALGRVGDQAELGAHLHVDFADPGRSLHRGGMGGRRADGIQAQLDRATEAAKLANLTARFTAAFGRSPRAFRAGRFGRSPHTLDLLVDLGYLVDSSVTPGLRWRYAEGEIDYRGEPIEPHWVECRGGRILEAPVSIWPTGPMAPILSALPRAVELVGRRALPRWAAYRWLRPSWGPPGRLAELARAAPERHLVVMFHSTEVVPGASPYARTQREADRVLERLERLLASWAADGNSFGTLTELAEGLPTAPVPRTGAGG